MTILDEIAAHARARVAQDMLRTSPEALMELAAHAPYRAAFLDKVRQAGVALICEVKKASPSKGVIDPVFDYMAIAADYEAAEADCISCLTEPKWFLGSDSIFGDIRRAVKTPMLRKDFVVDTYQLYQAKAMGADCALLICALHDTASLEKCLQICGRIGLDALVEAHDAREIGMAVEAGALMIGVNNRNLRDFTVDLDNAARLRDLIPPGRYYVAESGVKGPEDAAKLKRLGADAILMGETLMRAPDKRAALRAIREAVT